MTAAPSDAILTRLMALHPKVIDLTLDRCWRLLDALGNPQDALPPVVHIAGTNGKGSTLAMIRAGLDAAGLRVHAYTSPHLVRFQERIRLAGTLIAEPDLAALLDECEAANGGAPITYFEVTTCAALLAFARTPADVVLLEVGLGGRLDATNVVVPRLSVITPVSMDHEAFLGNTLAAIAGEKAGILKRGVPGVIGPQAEAALEVIEARAARLGAPLAVHGQHWHVGPDRDRIVYQDETGLLDLPRPVLQGPHQILNAGTAVAALRNLGLGPEPCEAAITRASWPGRLQRLPNGTLGAGPELELWLDGGHNPAAGLALANTLATLPPRDTHLIGGLLNTKDARGFFAPFAGHVTHVHAVSIPGEANTLPAERTAEAARSAGLDASVAADVEAAMARIAGRSPAARVLICGSLYLAGSVLRQARS